MLPRILEPEVMDTLDDALDYDAMDHSEVNRRFVDDFVRAGGCDDLLLDLGCGTALIPILLVETLPSARIVALDYSRNMLLLGRRHVIDKNLQKAILLLRADAKSLPFPDRVFPQVVSNSLIHHLPDPKLAFDEAYRVTKPGGLLFFRDLARPPNKKTLDRLVQLYAGNANQHQQQLLADSLAASLTIEEVAAAIQGFELTVNRLEMTSDRHWTWIARKA
ncbi:MAG: class I SAM-dependent methyltransferase [Thermogutta sp.]